MNNPLVSIITPSFNQAQFLEQTILSVLNQTYKNIEYFVMDGGSKDGSLDIIKKYDANITYWQSKADGGQADAINQAFAMCKGEIIAFINSDDLLMPNAVETAVACFEVNNETSMVHGNCSTINELGDEIETKKGSPVKFATVLEIGMLPYIYQPSCFFNRSQLKRDYFLDASFKYAFDYDLVLHLLKNHSCLYVNNHMAAYRVHPNAKSQNINAAFKEKLAVQKMHMTGVSLKWVYRKLKTSFVK
ncbi:MAG: glycosyltransferase family 2 protein [Bacteroidia bacterium]